MNLLVDDIDDVSETRVIESIPFETHIKNFDPVIASEYARRSTELNKMALVLENHFDMMDEGRRPQLFSQLSYGHRRAIEAVSWSSWLKTEAIKKERYARGMAWHENFNKYISDQEAKGNKVKATDKSRDMYVDIDPDVVKAREELAIIEAIHEQFNGLKFEFVQGQSTLKAMYYGNKDTSALNNAASFANLD